MNELRYKYVLFDLDGTVSRSAEGIRWSLENAVKELGAPMPDLDDYTLYIGPPLLDTFKRLCGCDEEEAQRGSAIYRDFYNREGKFKNTLYDGVKELLEELSRRGRKTAVCTSKYEGFAEEITEMLGVRGLFDAICGSTLDGARKDKKDIIPYAVRALGGAFPKDKDRTVMIGDTAFDLRGALDCETDFIGVSYGYGAVEEMKANGADKFAASPSDILKLLV